MKKNDFKQIVTLSQKELIAKIRQFKKEVADLVFDKNMKKLKDKKSVSKKKKDLAQVMTVFRQKELLAQLESKTAVKVEEKKAVRKEIKA